MKTRTLWLLSSLVIAIVLITVSGTLAQNYFLQRLPDGRIVITQDTVFGFALAGDGPGFPITIAHEGSYVLGGDIVVPNANTTAIEITASNVTLDLNGFSIKGPTVCSGAPFVTNCSPTGTGRGVNAAESPSITVRNGTVTGMGEYGVFVGGPGSLVERVHASHNGADGFSVASGVVLHSTASHNGGHGMTLSSGVAFGNVARSNHGTGFSGVLTAAAAHNFSGSNGSDVMQLLQTAGNVCNNAFC